MTQAGDVIHLEHYIFIKKSPHRLHSQYPLYRKILKCNREVNFNCLTFNITLILYITFHSPTNKRNKIFIPFYPSAITFNHFLQGSHFNQTTKPHIKRNVPIHNFMMQTKLELYTHFSNITLFLAVMHYVLGGKVTLRIIRTFSELKEKKKKKFLDELEQRHVKPNTNRKFTSWIIHIQYM